MAKNMVQGIESILADDRIEQDERLSEEARSGLLFVTCTLTLILTGAVLMLHAG